MDMTLIFLIFAVAIAVIALVIAWGWHLRANDANATSDKYRTDYSRNLEELNRTYQDKNAMEIAWAKTERENKNLDAMWQRQGAYLDDLDSQIYALTELWRHSAARAFDLDEECTANRILYYTDSERTRCNDVANGTQIISALIVVNRERIERTGTLGSRHEVTVGSTIAASDIRRQRAAVGGRTRRSGANGIEHNYRVAMERKHRLNIVEARTRRSGAKLPRGTSIDLACGRNW